MSLISDFRAFVTATFFSNGNGGIDGSELQSALLQVAGLLETQTSWMPVLSLVQNGPNTVVKITDWSGGVGVKPPLNVYFTTAGYSPDINAAVNLRGPQGLAGLPGTGIVSTAVSVTSPAVQYFPIFELPASSGTNYDFAEFEVTIKPWDSGAYMPIRLRIWIANRGDFQYQWSYIGLIADFYNVVVYRLADGRAVAYLKLDNTFKSASARVANHNQATVYSSLIGQPTVSGTKMFDSSDIVAYPPLMQQTPAKTTLPSLDVLGVGSFRSAGGTLDLGVSPNGKSYIRSAPLTGTPGIELYIANTKIADVDASGNVGIGNTAAEKLDVEGRIRSRGLVRAGALPTIAKGPAVGTGTAALVVNSCDMAGAITLTTAGTPTANSVLCSVTFNNPYGKTPEILISAKNAQSANAMPRVWSLASTTGFNLYAGITALDNTQSFEFAYLIIA